jgi:hypothetical protein
VSRFLRVLVTSIYLMTAFVTSDVLAGPASNMLSSADGNSAARDIAKAAPAIQSAYKSLSEAAGRLAEPSLSSTTQNGLQDGTCIFHRAGLRDIDKDAILDHLVEAGWLNAPEDDQARAELIKGVFPKVLKDGTACPQLPQPVWAAPGGNNASHHDWPGGLVVHEAFNLQNALDLSAAYRVHSGITPDDSMLAAAVIWHDWGKALVFQWQADGSEDAEIRIAGTGAHHILGLAETMRRGLAARQIQVQACAHAAPDGNGQPVENWLKAAAVIARVNASDYLPKDNLWPEECYIHTLSDQNWIVGEASAQIADKAMAELAPLYGFDPANHADYNWKFRLILLSHLGADQIAEASRRGGSDALKTLIDKQKLF